MDNEWLGLLKRQLIKIYRCIQAPILALDTSQRSASICLVNALGDEIHTHHLDTQALASESIAPALNQILRFSEIQSLRGMVVGLGPGSFTGLRVGLALIKGLSLSANIPVYGVSSLATIAASYGPGIVACLLDARLGEILAGIYRVDKRGCVHVCHKDGAYTYDRFRQILQKEYRSIPVLTNMPVDELKKNLYEEIDAQPIRLHAGFSILQVQKRIASGQSDTLDTLVPQYLRVSEAERKMQL